MTTNYLMGSAQKLFIWGENGGGELGTNTNGTDSYYEVETAAGGNNWIFIDGSKYNDTDTFLGGIKDDGSLWMWGTNVNKILGDGTTTPRSSPVLVFGSPGAWKTFSVGSTHIIAIKNSGELWGWGRNTEGQLGDGTTTVRSSPVQTVAGGNNWSKISAAAWNSAAIKTDGTLWVWGQNVYGQIGDDTRTSRSSPTQTISAGTNWSNVEVVGSVGVAASMVAIKTDGTLWTWGRNNNGALGDGTSLDRSSPVQTLAGGSNWVQVTSGSGCVAAIKSDGTLWTWGYNLSGRLGVGDLVHRSSPTQISGGGTDWKYVAIGDHGYAIKNDNTFWGWGSGASRQLGPTSTSSSYSPIQLLTNIQNYVSIKPVMNNGMMIRKQFIDFDDVYIRKSNFSTGGVWGWGDNASGTLGDGTNSNHRSSPVQTLAGGTPWKLVIGGWYLTLAIRDNGSLWGWGGTQSYGELGDTTRVPKSSPIQIIPSSANTWTQATSGWGHAAALKTDGTLWTWGNNTDGQLGSSNVTHRSSPAQVVGNSTEWKLVSAGATHTMAIKTNGTLWTWGTNSDRELGNFSFWPVSSPVQTILGGTNWKYISGGFQFSTAIKSDTSLWVWGRGSSGQLGLGDNTLRSSPVQLSMSWRVVAAAKYHTLGIKTDGTLWTWGHNATGALGDGTIIHRSSPIQTLAGGTNWKSAAGANFLSAATKTDGTLWVWGHNNTGQLAQGDKVHRSSPVQTISGGTLWKSVHCGDEYMVAIQEDYF